MRLYTYSAYARDASFALHSSAGNRYSKNKNVECVIFKFYNVKKNFNKTNS